MTNIVWGSTTSTMMIYQSDAISVSYLSLNEKDPDNLYLYPQDVLNKKNVLKNPSQEGKVARIAGSSKGTSSLPLAAPYLKVK